MFEAANAGRRRFQRRPRTMSTVPAWVFRCAAVGKQADWSDGSVWRPFQPPSSTMAAEAFEQVIGKWGHGAVSERGGEKGAGIF